MYQIYNNFTKLSETEALKVYRARSTGTSELDTVVWQYFALQNFHVLIFRV